MEESKTTFISFSEHDPNTYTFSKNLDLEDLRKIIHTFCKRNRCGLEDIHHILMHPETFHYLYKDGLKKSGTIYNRAYITDEQHPTSGLQRKTVYGCIAYTTYEVADDQIKIFRKTRF